MNPVRFVSVDSSERSNSFFFVNIPSVTWRILESFWYSGCENRGVVWGKDWTRETGARGTVVGERVVETIETVDSYIHRRRILTVMTGLTVKMRLRRMNEYRVCKHEVTIKIKKKPSVRPVGGWGSVSTTTVGEKMRRLYRSDVKWNVGGCYHILLLHKIHTQPVPFLCVVCL